MMYTDRITYADYLIATRDELAIEEEALTLSDRNDGSDFNARARASIVDALLRVDEAKINGCYDVLRGRMLAIVKTEDAESGHAARLKQFGENMKKVFESDGFDAWAEHFSNFLSGLQSPDAAQRKRFNDLFDNLEIGSWHPHDSPALFAALERVRGRQGRPSVSPPWRNVNDHLDAIRKLCASGHTIPSAARSVADAEGNAASQSRAKYFERLYREKIKLRGQ
ncbi:MAG: hypothetical protein WBB85_02595 [Albidovulum sp.]|uniref:hypothetical protein n=1 Tax=Albidovulum sp. TaxID=1872424 RepID=UPI003CB44FBE